MDSCNSGCRFVPLVGCILVGPTRLVVAPGLDLDLGPAPVLALAVEVVVVGVPEVTRRGLGTKC